MKSKSNKTYFKSDNLKYLDKDLPIKLSKIEYIINTVSKKYPTIKKSEISLIIKVFIEEIRNELIQGNIITINDLFLNMRLYTYCKLNNNQLRFNTRVQLTTPRHIKYVK